MVQLARLAPPVHREREDLLVRQVRPVPRALLVQLVRLAPLVHREKEVLLAQPARLAQQVLPVQLAPLVRPVLAARRIH